MPGDDPLPAVTVALQEKILSSFTPEARLFHKQEFNFFDSITNISGQLRDIVDKTQHNAFIKDRLTTNVPQDGLKEGLLYLPTSPYSQCVSVNVDSGTPMQSAAKCPFLLVFKVRPFGGPDEALRSASVRDEDDEGEEGEETEFESDDESESEEEDESTQVAGTQTSRAKAARQKLGQTAGKVKRHAGRVKSRVQTKMRKLKQRGKKNRFDKQMAKLPTPAASAVTQACIFKVYDDCRQDVLCIQIIQLFSDCFKSAGLPLYLKPYRVIANRTGDDMAVGGIIEVVPECRSRDQLGKSGSRDLFRYFQSQFGTPESENYRVAQYHFAVSMAAYAIVCYILWIKDRHNGNLLVDNYGHIIHIDFGFLLGISPGGNLGFETAAFKLTKEMVDILGGSTDSKPFKFFTELCVKVSYPRMLVGAMACQLTNQLSSVLLCARR
jgi:hypothetical protein